MLTASTAMEERMGSKHKRGVDHNSCARHPCSLKVLSLLHTTVVLMLLLEEE